MATESIEERKAVFMRQYLEIVGEIVECIVMLKEANEHKDILIVEGRVDRVAQMLAQLSCQLSMYPIQTLEKDEDEEAYKNLHEAVQMYMDVRDVIDLQKNAVNSGAS